MAASRVPNRRLAAVMEQARISNKGLAAQVRDLANRDGKLIAADHISVRRWLDGTTPKEETQRYIALALSARLSRRVSLDEIGYEETSDAGDTDLAEHGAEYPSNVADSVGLLEKLTTADLSDQSGILRAKWASAPAMITSYLFGQPLTVATSLDACLQGAPQAAAIRATAAHLMDLDFHYGGGHVRKMLLFYFQSEIAPLLRQTHPEPMRSELFSAAAEVAELLGWSAYDAGRHGAAQRYFVQGLRLAREANDPMMGGRILASMSHQANYLGKFADAAQLARAAQSAAVGKSTATVTTMFMAMEARALASSGMAKECVQVLHRAEQLFEQRDTDSDPEWIRYFDAYELSGEAAHCFRDLGRPEETRLFAGRAIEPASTPPRTRAFIGMVTAAGALAAGDLDEAVALALSAVDSAGALQSKRYVRYLTDFHDALTSTHGQHPLINDFANAVNMHYPTLTLPSGLIVATAA